MPRTGDDPVEPPRGRCGGGRTALVLLSLAVLAGCTGVDDVAGGHTAAPVRAPATAPAEAGPGLDTLSLAEAAFADGRTDDAKALLGRVVPGTDKVWRARLLVAELHLAGGAHDTAAAAFHALISAPGVGAQALQGEGIALLLAGDGEAGYASLRAAVASDSTLWRAWNALGYYFDVRGESRRAEESYTRALSANPTSAVILNNRGFSMLMQGRIDEALADLGQALLFDPASPPARENHRLALAWHGDYVLAMAGVEESGLAHALNNVGYVALLRGDHDTAEAYFLRALEADTAFNALAARNLEHLHHVRALAPAEAQGAKR